MSLNGLRPRLAVWLALFAMLLAVAMPTIARLSQPDISSSAIEVCTTDGLRWLPGDGDEAPLPGPNLDHCAYCLSAHHPALPSIPGGLSLPLAAQTLLPRLLFTAPRPLFAWSPAHPRAPPAAA